MLVERLSRSVTGVLLACSALFVAAAGAAQEREVVSKQIAVGRNEASLRLEFASGDPLEVSFSAGRFQVDGRGLGASSPELEAAWRSLLGQAVALEDGPLARALVEWSPPAGLAGAALETATAIDQALEGALHADPLAQSEDLLQTRSPERSVVAALLGRRERLVELAQALEDVSLADVQLHVAEEVTVEQGAQVDGTVVMVDGNLEVRGEVDGDVVIVGGSVRLHPEGRVTGDVHLIDARLYRDGGEVEGEVVELDEDGAQVLEALDRDDLREEIEREIRESLTDMDQEPRGFLAPFRHIGSGIAGVFSTLLTVLVMGVVGGVVLHFAGSNLEVVAETARRAPARAAMVGLAGTFLAVPVWLLGAVALVISIIGIPVALFWLPLFPLAVVLAAGLGYYAVAHNVGAWIARHRYPYLGWVRISNPYTLLAGGLLGLMAAFIVANALEIGGPWLGFLEGLFLAVGIVGTVLAVLVGFGAVLITRAGRRAEYYAGGRVFDDGWDDDLGSGGAADSWWRPSGSGGSGGSGFGGAPPAAGSTQREGSATGSGAPPGFTTESAGPPGTTGAPGEETTTRPSERQDEREGGG